MSVSANFYEWKDVFPELQILKDNIPVILAEAETIPSWIPWPEDHFSSNSLGSGTLNEWTVFPFLHTFPALAPENSKWIPSTNQHCKKTSALLKSIPNIRTALLSRLGPGTTLGKHTGWADLANHVLRCHICLKIPTNEAVSSGFITSMDHRDGCGLWVNNEIKYHEQGEVIVFDDSKKHYAFNTTSCDRLVLIVDILRPDYIPLGTAKGGHTPELDDFISRFR